MNFRDTPQSFQDTWFENSVALNRYTIYEEGKGYIVQGNVNLSTMRLREIPFPFYSVLGLFTVRQNTWLESTKNFPKYAGQLTAEGTVFKEVIDLPKKVYDWVYFTFDGKAETMIKLLFVDCPEIKVVTRHNQEASPELTRIINTGRDNGRMPRELIPGKINQIRDMML